jgi:hypothetical protein
MMTALRPMNEHDVIAGAVATKAVAAMLGTLAGWLSPDRMKNGLTIDTGPRHRTEDSHAAVYRSRRIHERWSGCRPPKTASQCARIVVFTATERKGRQP